MTAGLDYGNTRLRARKGLLLGPDDYSRMTRSETLERVVGVLADTDYGPDLATALPRYSGLRILDEALRSNLARNLRAMRSFYDSDLTQLDLLLDRFDLQNLRTILRAQARLLGREQITPFLTPAGLLSDSQLTELASQPGPRATIDLMVAWGIPSRPTARRLLHLWPQYEVAGEPAVLEDALNQAYAEHVGEALTEEPDECLTLIRAEIDAINLLTALRMLQARLDGEPETGVPGVTSFLASGTVSPTTLLAIEWADDPDEVTAILAGLAGLPVGWRPAVAAWVGHGNLVTLSHDLDRALTHWALALFHTADPLSLAVPVAYVKAKENEARNVRLIGRGIVNRLLPVDIEQQLVIP